MELAASELDSAVPPLLYYAYPGAVFSFFLAASLFSVCTLHNLRHEWQLKAESSGQQYVVGALSVFNLTYLVQLICLVVFNGADEQWPPAEHSVVGNLSCLLVFGIQLSWLSTATDLVWYPYQGAWIIALAFETTLGAFGAVQSHTKTLSRHHTVELVLTILRCALLLVLVFWASFWRCVQAIHHRSDEEHQPLLADAANGTPSGYGSTSDTEAASDEEAEYNWERREREAKEIMEKRLKEGGNWFTYAKGFMVSESLSAFATYPPILTPGPGTRSLYTFLNERLELLTTRRFSSLMCGLLEIVSYNFEPQQWGYAFWGPMSCIC